MTKSKEVTITDGVFLESGAVRIIITSKAYAFPIREVSDGTKKTRDR